MNAMYGWNTEYCATYSMCPRELFALIFSNSPHSISWYKVSCLRMDLLPASPGPWSWPLWCQLLPWLPWWRCWARQCVVPIHHWADPFKKLPAAVAAGPDLPGCQADSKTAVMEGCWASTWLKSGRYKRLNGRPWRKLQVFSWAWRKDLGIEKEQDVVNPLPSLHLRPLPALKAQLEPWRQAGRDWAQTPDSLWNSKAVCNLMGWEYSWWVLRPCIKYHFESQSVPAELS